ncbi:MAG: HAD family hydrolase [Synechococcales cyanobacterium T60_A2020_003]|nr:HAD family hydrolase [Synechococcales cyanobacterium T60_A2020_003]
MLRIITDFDGPIMDVSERYYQVYRFCLEQVRRPDQSVRELSKSEFWALKRSRTVERQIGQLSGLDEDQSNQFAKLRRDTVHTVPYLQYDQPIASAIPTLERIQAEGIDLAVMTMRRVSELDDAFTRYDLGRFFPENRRYCLSNTYVKTADVKDKPILMERALAELPVASSTWMIGDTEADIVAAKTHGIRMIAVLSGIRDRQQLATYSPDYIVDTMADAVSLIMNVEASSVAQAS